MRITYEDGNIVIRDNRGVLIWSKSVVDLNSGAPEVYFSGEIIERIYDTKEYKRKFINDDFPISKTDEEVIAIWISEYEGWGGNENLFFNGGKLYSRREGILIGWIVDRDVYMDFPHRSPELKAYQCLAEIAACSEGYKIQHF